MIFLTAISGEVLFILSLFTEIVLHTLLNFIPAGVFYFLSKKSDKFINIWFNTWPGGIIVLIYSLLHNIYLYSNNKIQPIPLILIWFLACIVSGAFYHIKKLYFKKKIITLLKTQYYLLKTTHSKRSSSLSNNNIEDCGTMKYFCPL